MSDWTLADLRAANITRQAEWFPDQVLDLSFRGVELGGETGEALNVIKKLERERLCWCGSRDTVEHLMEELADVVICADLVAERVGGNLMAAVLAKFNATSQKVGLQTRLDAAEQCSLGEVDPCIPKAEDIAEAMSNGGFWTTCSGCHETEDGYDVGYYPYSKIYHCKVGSGCSECGGIGVLWNDPITDADIALMCAEPDAIGQAEVVAVERAEAYCRPEVLAFARLMERELRANDHKPGWKNDKAELLALRVHQEAGELWATVESFAPPKRDEIASEAADVANLAMMVADVSGCLDDMRAPHPPAPRPDPAAVADTKSD